MAAIQELDIESRLLGKLALQPEEQCTAMLVAQLDSKKVLFHRKLLDPADTATTAFTLINTAAQLGSAAPVLIKIETQSDSASFQYRVISTDGKYLLYAEIERPN